MQGLLAAVVADLLLVVADLLLVVTDLLLVVTDLLLVVTDLLLVVADLFVFEKAVDVLAILILLCCLSFEHCFKSAQKA